MMKFVIAPHIICTYCKVKIQKYINIIPTIERETCSVALLKKALVEHLNGDCNNSFDISIVPKATIVKEEIKDEAMLVSSTPRVPKITREGSAARLAQLSGIQALGPIHRTTPAIQLTESETEYTVSCVKHIFPWILNKPKSQSQLKTKKFCIYIYDII